MTLKDMKAKTEAKKVKPIAKRATMKLSDIDKGDKEVRHNQALVVVGTLQKGPDAGKNWYGIAANTGNAKERAICRSDSIEGLKKKLAILRSSLDIESLDVLDLR